MYIYKWSEVVRDTQSAQTLPEEDGHNKTPKTLW